MPGSYSTTPLERKLGIKEGFTILLYRPPIYYLDLFKNLPGGLEFVETADGNSVDLAHLFCKRFNELEPVVTSTLKGLKKDGCIWLSWPKGSSELETDLRRDPIREQLITMGLVDIKVASINEDWSGLKFVYPLKDR